MKMYCLEHIEISSTFTNGAVLKGIIIITYHNYIYIYRRSGNFCLVSIQANHEPRPCLEGGLAQDYNFIGFLS